MRVFASFRLSISRPPHARWPGVLQATALGLCLLSGLVPMSVALANTPDDEGGRAQQVIATALERDPENADLRYQAALALQRLGDMNAAMEELRATIALDPSHVDARLRLAELYEMQERHDDAIDQYRTVLNISDPGSDLHADASRRLRYAIATRHARRGEVGIALEMFEDLARDFPDNVLIVYSAAVANLLSNRLDEARSAFERVIALDPAYSNAYLNLATVDESQGRIEQAVANLRRVIELGPDAVPAVRAQIRLDIIEGNLLSQEGNYQDAISAYERVLEFEPGNRVALNGLVAIYQQLEDMDAERRVYVRIVRFYPDDDRSRMRLAQLHILSDDLGPAVDELEALIARGQQGPYFEQARTVLARLMMTEPGRELERERIVSRIDALQDRLRADPDDAQAWKDLGIILLRQNARDEAAAAFEEVLRLEPGDRQTRDALALLYDHLGRFPESVREYAWLVALETDGEAAGRLVTALRMVNVKNLYARGNHALARDELNTLIEKDSDNQIAHFYLGLIAADEEDMVKAVDAYREVVRIVPSHVGARMNLAFSYERLNREEDAIDEYRKILQASPSSDIAEQARRRLQNVQRRIRGVSVNAGYLMAYDSNSNLSDDTALEDFRSDLSLNLSYQYKMQNDLRWRFLMSPVYTNYHKGQFDYLNSTLTASASLMPGRYTLVGGYTYRSSASLITDSRLSRMHSLFAEAMTRYRMPSLVRPFAGESVPTFVSANLSYSDFDARSSPFFSSYTTSAGLSLTQSVTDRTRLRLGYSAVNNENKEFVGNDYAFFSHGVNIGADRQMPWGSVNINYGYTWFDYSNPDSFSQFTRYRKNTRHNLALGANYSFKRDIGFFATISWTDNSSNLPVGFVLGREDIIEGLQSSSLSDYRRLMITTGMNISF